MGKLLLPVSFYKRCHLTYYFFLLKGLRVEMVELITEIETKPREFHQKKICIKIRSICFWWTLGGVIVLRDAIQEATGKLLSESAILHAAGQTSEKKTSQGFFPLKIETWEKHAKALVGLARRNLKLLFLLRFASPRVIYLNFLHLSRVLTLTGSFIPSCITPFTHEYDLRTLTCWFRSHEANNGSNLPIAWTKSSSP